MKKKSFPVIPVVIAVIALSIVGFVNLASVQPQTAGMEAPVQEAAAAPSEGVKDEMAGALKKSTAAVAAEPKVDGSGTQGKGPMASPMREAESPEAAARPQPKTPPAPQKPRVDPNAVSSQWYDEDSAVGR